MNKQEEYHAQVAIFEWSYHNETKYPDLEYLFSTLNGVRLPIGLAKKVKRAGNKKGVPDIWLPIARDEHKGLIVELKREKGGTVSPEQKKWLKKLNMEGFCAVVCYGSEQAIQTIERYLNLK